MPSSTVTRAVLLTVAATLAAAACGPAPGSPSADSDDRAVTIFAAASLTEVFTDLAEEFEREHPNTDLTLSFGPSSGLATSITEGAPADVFASADPVTMDRVVDADLAENPRAFARNQLVIAIPDGNPAGVRTLRDFADEALLIGVCAEQVPCGRAARAAFEAQGITPEPDTLSRDVKGVLTAVRTSEIDAGLVYRTDVAAADDVQGIDFDGSADAVNDYQITVLTETAGNVNEDVAEAFVDFVASDGRSTLRSAGFRAP